MNKDISKLEPLLIALVDGSLRDDQLEELRVLLRNSAAARKHYAAYMLVHGALTWRDAPSLTEVDATHEQGATAEKFAPSESGEADSSSGAQVVPRIARTLTRHITASSMWTATVVIGLLITVMAFTVPPFYRAMTATPETPTLPVAIVAEITGLENAEWPPSETGTHLGAHLVSGRKLQLTKGLAEITFRSGASVILEGPTKLRVNGTNDGHLEVGKIVAIVPMQAKGFSVTTATARVVDLGTEFGMATAPDGATEVHVFSGRVEAAARTADETWGPVTTIKAQEAARLQAGSVQVVSAANRSEIFQRKIADAPFEMGSPTVRHPLVDSAAGVTLVFGGIAPRSGQARTFTFYGLKKGNWVTPLLFRFDPATNTYSISGIGTSIESKGMGEQSAPFVLIAGTPMVEAKQHTFGFFAGRVAASGGEVEVAEIQPNTGSVSFDFQDGPWRYAYQELPREISVGRSYSLSGGADEVLGAGRIYSARLHVSPPDKQPAPGDSPEASK